MDKVISTALLTIAAVLAAVMVINTMIPALGRSGGSVLSASTEAADIIKTDIEIISVLTASTEIYVWVKNVGVVDIVDIDKADVFLEDVGAASFTRMTYEIGSVTNDCTASPASTDEWVYCYEDGETLWKPNDTIKVTILLTGAPSGEYKVQFATSNGVTVDKTFSV